MNIKLKTGIYQHLPEDDREAYLEARRKIRAHEDSLRELADHEKRFGESRDVELIRTKVHQLIEEAEASLRLLILRLNAEYRHLSTSVRRRGKPSENAG